jgi:AraC-like DNA-binding protein
MTATLADPCSFVLNKRDTARGPWRRVSQNGPMSDTGDPIARGILHPRTGKSRYVESLRNPSPELADMLLQCWSVQWDLRGRDPHVVRVLPSPSVQFVVEDGHPRIHGVGTGQFSHALDGTGDIFGVSFQPAGFRPLLGSAVVALTNRVVPAAEVFGPDVNELAGQVAGVLDIRRRLELVELYLRSRPAPADPKVPLINRIVAEITDDRTIVRVDDIVSRFSVGKRTLQRLFKEYVGVTPKWVIQRYRLHEAADRLDSGYTDLATLAAELGYADQAHFARDFKSVVGQPPAEFARG